MRIAYVAGRICLAVKKHKKHYENLDADLHWFRLVRIKSCTFWPKGYNYRPANIGGASPERFEDSFPQVSLPWASEFTLSEIEGKGES